MSNIFDPTDPRYSDVEWSTVPPDRPGWWWWADEDGRGVDLVNVVQKDGKLAFGYPESWESDDVPKQSSLFLWAPAVPPRPITNGGDQ